MLEQSAAISLLIVARQGLSRHAAYNLSDCSSTGGSPQAAAVASLSLQPAWDDAQPVAALWLYVAYQMYQYLAVNAYAYDPLADRFQLRQTRRVPTSVGVVRLALDADRGLLYALPGYGVWVLSLATGEQTELVVRTKPRWDSAPTALALDADSRLLYLEDLDHRRVIQFNLSSSQVSQYFPLPVNGTLTQEVYSLLFDPQLQALVVALSDDWASTRILLLSCSRGGQLAAAYRLSGALTAVAMAVTSNSERVDVYLADALYDAVVHVALHRPLSSPLTPIATTASTLNHDATLSMAFAAAVDQRSEAGSVFVAACRGACVKRFDAFGFVLPSPSFTMNIKDAGVVVALAVDGRGGLYAASLRGYVARFLTATGLRVALFSGFFQPIALCASLQRSELYVADSAPFNASVWLLDTASDRGAIQARFGSPDGLDWQPQGLAVDDELRLLYVNDPSNQRLLALQADHGGRLQSIFPFASTLGALMAGLALDAERGLLLVADPQGHRVVLLNSSTGSVLDKVELPSSLAQMSPTGVALSRSTMRLYAADPVRGALLIFDMTSDRTL